MPQYRRRPSRCSLQSSLSSLPQDSSYGCSRDYDINTNLGGGTTQQDLNESLKEWDSHWDSLYTMDDESIYTTLTGNEVIFEDLPTKPHVSDDDDEEEEEDSGSDDDDDVSLDRPRELGLQREEMEQMIKLLRGSSDLSQATPFAPRVVDLTDEASIYSSILNGTSPAIQKAQKKKKKQQKKEDKPRRQRETALQRMQDYDGPPTPYFNRRAEKETRHLLEQAPRHQLVQPERPLTPPPFAARTTKYLPPQVQEEIDEFEHDLVEDDEDEQEEAPQDSPPTPIATKKQLQARKRAEARKSVRAKKDAETNAKAKCTSTSDKPLSKSEHHAKTHCTSTSAKPLSKSEHKAKAHAPATKTRSQSLSEYLAQAGTMPLVPDLVSQDPSEGEIKIPPMTLPRPHVPAPPGSIHLPPWMNTSKWTTHQNHHHDDDDEEDDEEDDENCHPQEQAPPFKRTLTAPPALTTATVPAPVTPSPPSSKFRKSTNTIPTTARTVMTPEEPSLQGIPQQPEERKRWWFSFWHSMQQKKAKKKFLKKSRKENTQQQKLTHRHHPSWEQTTSTESSTVEDVSSSIDGLDHHSALRALPVVMENGLVEC